MQNLLGVLVLFLWFLVVFLGAFGGWMVQAGRLLVVVAVMVMVWCVWRVSLWLGGLCG